MRRRVFYLDAETEAALRAQAKAHGVSMGEIVRSRVRGVRPGATPGSEAAAADQWWDTRPPTRRVSVWRNHNTVRDETPGDPHQVPLFEGEL